MTLIEIVVVTAIVVTMFAFSLPVIQGALSSYHLSQASIEVAGVIQSTRYQAIMRGCPYTVAFDPSSSNYQVATQPISGTPPVCAASFSNVGAALPWSTTGDVSLAASTTLQMNPNGTVIATVGSPVLSLVNGSRTSTITVSGVGNVSVNTP